MSEPLLSVEGLTVAFGPEGAQVRAVEDVSFRVPAGGAVGLVGESGSGKSVTSLSILRLLAPSATILGGRILFDGANLLGLPADKMPDIRGRDIAMIFQEPMSSLNPLMTVGDQIGEAILLHEAVGRGERGRRVVELLRRVGIPDAEERCDAYPHQFSGGMRQRVMIAMALACNPRLLIADEPTTALDVTIQAQVLDLMRTLRADTGTAILLISHDLGVIAEMCDSVVIMYAGRVVETGDVRSIFHDARHPYTQGLLASIPRLDDERHRLHQIPGSVPSPAHRGAGCAFAPRCPVRQERCTREQPAFAAIASDRRVACFAEGSSAA
jgi:peptide/nickel transport system ATP-binding protein